MPPLLRGAVFRHKEMASWEEVDLRHSQGRPMASPGFLNPARDLSRAFIGRTCFYDVEISMTQDRN